MTSWREPDGLLKAEKCAKPWFPRGRRNGVASAAAAKLGLRYEAKVAKNLKALPVVAKFERNPWFRFVDLQGMTYCSPDGIIKLVDGTIVVYEVKYTYTPEAMQKLETLYSPVVRRALRLTVPPLLLTIARNLVPGAPTPCYSFSSALTSEHRLLQWLGQGSI